MTQDVDSILRFDLSLKTATEISDFFSALLETKRTLARSGINIHVCPRTRRISMNKTPESDSPCEFLGFTTTE